MSLLIRVARKLPIDFGQGEFKHKAKAKQIAFSNVKKYNATENQSDIPVALDVGCGDGYWSEKIKELGYKTVSIDMHREYPNVDSDYEYSEMIPTDINEKLPFEDDSFDLVWCSEVIEHVQNHESAIMEMRRVLKPNGKLIITTPNSYFWLQYLMQLIGLENSDWQNEGHVNFYNFDTIKRLKEII